VPGLLTAHGWDPSAIQGNDRWQLPHRGVPFAATGTLFRLPQFGHCTNRALVADMTAAHSAGFW
jgi:hypothetical protein